MAILTPKTSLDEEDISRGLRWLLWDGMASQLMACLTGGAVLTGFAVLAGASHTTIGFIAAIAPLSQILQLPAVALVEHVRRRKLLVIVCSAAARPVWLAVAAIPWLAESSRMIALISCLLVFNGLSTIASCAFNSWKRDIVPEYRMGSYFARRLMLATLVGAVVTLLAGVLLDWGQGTTSDPLKLFSPIFAVGALAGIIGVLFLSRMSEPIMPAPGGKSLWQTLTEPLREENFRCLVIFLACWNFAANFSAPFMTVYIIQRLDMSMSWVLGLTAISQMANMAALTVWGQIADRFGNKLVLIICGWLFLTTLLMWPFTTMPNRHFLTVPLLILIHIQAGLALAGVNLCAGGLALKQAPRGKATAFLAVNALISGAAATLAPIMSGPLADGLSEQTLTFHVNWTSGTAPTYLFTALDIRGLDFLFFFAFALGLYALHRLLAVKEQGVIEEDDVAQAFYEGLRRLVRPGTLAGLRQLAQFPFASLKVSHLAEAADRAKESGRHKEVQGEPPQQ